MNIKEREKIYLDANFLVYWALPKTPEIKKRVRFLLAKIIKENINTSCLSMDEAWWGIKNEYNKIYNNQFGCSDEPIFSLIKNFTEKITKKIEILQFNNEINGINEALRNIKEFKLRPRDAFHLAIVKDNDVAHLISNDNDFAKRKEQIKKQIGVNIINF